MMMRTNKKTARIAAAIYLIVLLTGLFSLAYVLSKLIDRNNPAQLSKLSKHPNCFSG